MDIEQKIEALLFWKGESISRKKLSEVLEVDIQEINDAIEKLKENFQNRGIVVMEKENEIMLGTAPELSELFEKIQKEELNKELSKASLETLSIVLYKNGASRAEIDYIRGVNSSFILRNLAIRGLVEKVIDDTDNRKYIYKPTFELLSFMGVKNIQELSDFTNINDVVEKTAQEFAKQENNEEAQ
ncbi:SMC-Scp complex subunit ScpB [Candidatus Nomurabacteria bacterium]|nr:SMC-Scp complex subunit ScpB [Candidatus Nomurabacteria bacterium]